MGWFYGESMDWFCAIAVDADLSAAPMMHIEAGSVWERDRITAKQSRGQSWHE